MKNICSYIFSFLLLLSSPLSYAQDTYSINGIDEKLFNTLNVDLDQPLTVVIQQMVHQLEQQGYFLAVVSAGTDNTIRVDLGSIEKIDFYGLSSKVQERARGYLAAAMSSTPELVHFDHALALINDMPGISVSMAFEINPATANYTLVISGEESMQFGGVTIDSSPRNLAEQNRVSLQQNFFNLFTGGDIIRLQGGYVAGDGLPSQRSLYLDYQLPIGNSGLYAEVSIGDVDTQTALTAPSSLSFVTGNGFVLTPGATTRQDFEGQFASVALGYPLSHHHDGAIYIVGNIDVTSDSTDDVGDTDIIFTEFNLLKTYYSPDGWSYVASITAGGGDVDSYLNQYDGHFTRGQFHLGFISPFELVSYETELRLELTGQLGSSDTPNALLLALGEEQFLRGYESSTFSGTDGLIGTAELAYPFYIEGSLVRQITSFVFLDAGTVTNPDRWVSPRRPKKDSLISVGFGADISLSNRFRIYGYIGAPLSEDYSGSTPDPRGYLRLDWSW